MPSFSSISNDVELFYFYVKSVFLFSSSRNHGRYKSKQGFVDSSRRIRSLHRQQEQLYGSQTQTPGSRGGILAEIKKSSSPALAAGVQTPGRSHLSKEKDAALISANLESKRKDYEKQMRLIEVCPR